MTNENHSKPTFVIFFPYLSSSNAQKIGLWNRSSWRTISEQNNWNESNSWTIGNEFRQRRVEVEWNSKNKVHIYLDNEKDSTELRRCSLTYRRATVNDVCVCVIVYVWWCSSTENNTHIHRTEQREQNVDCSDKEYVLGVTICYRIVCLQMNFLRCDKWPYRFHVFILRHIFKISKNNLCVSQFHSLPIEMYLTNGRENKRL